MVGAQYTTHGEDVLQSFFLKLAHDLMRSVHCSANLGAIAMLSHYGRGKTLVVSAHFSLELIVSESEGGFERVNTLFLPRIELQMLMQQGVNFVFDPRLWCDPDAHHQNGGERCCKGHQRDEQVAA